MAPQIRIAFGLDSFQLGGTELNAVRTAERLDRTRFDLVALALHCQGPLLERYHSADVPVVEFLIRGLVSPQTLRQGFRLVRWLREARIQIVHTHDVYTNIFIVPWARIAGVPVVVASRRFWYTVPRPGLIAANRLAYRFAHRVLANSESVARLLTEQEHVRAADVLTIPNFVDDDGFRPLGEATAARFRSDWNLSPRTTSVGVVARLDPVKRHADLLHAFARALGRAPGSPATSMWRLVIVGDGPERARLEALSTSLGIGHAVCFAGMIPPTPGLASLFDVVALASEAEGFPNSILEAMAAGRPVVATRVGGIPDCVVDGVNGLLVPPASVDDLATALTALLTDGEMRARFGAAGRERAMKRYHARSVMRLLEDTYASLVTRESGVPSEASFNP